MWDSSTCARYSSRSSISKSTLIKVRLSFMSGSLSAENSTSSVESMDYTKLWNDIRTSVSLVEGDTNPAPGQGTFAHITGGYDAGYYGYAFSSVCIFYSSHRFLGCHSYTYSLVFAADMYATAFKTNPLDPATGNKYRNEILLPGGSREEMDSLKVIHYKFVIALH